jgi:AraC-like DNA-binding protein
MSAAATPSRQLSERVIGREAGFAGQAHLTRMFKAAFGMTPGRYVKLCAAAVQCSYRITVSL